MRTFSLLLALGLMALLVAAAPSRIQKRSFKIERRRNPHFRGRNGPRELVKAYRKYRMPIPAALLDHIREGGGVLPVGGQSKADGGGGGSSSSSSSSSSGDGSGGGIFKSSHRGKGSRPRPFQVPANGTSGGNQTVAQTDGNAVVGQVVAVPEGGDVEYLAPIEIGGQTIEVDFDSGSSDLWVFNTQLPAAAAQGHTLYDPQQSPSFRLLAGASFSISYGDGSGAAGNVGTDTVNVGGATVTRQAVELATAVSQSFVQDRANNGLLGLAFSQLNTVKPQQQKTFFDNVLPTLAEPVFTADLRRGAVGAYEFGRVDASKFRGALTWVPVNTSQGFWQFGTQAFFVGERGAPTRVNPAQAIADTGTTLLLAGPEVINGYYGQVRGAANDASAGGITIPCDADLPDLFLDVGGVYFARIKGEDINFAHIRDNTCFGGLQPTTSDLEIWGDIFFKSQFVVFNGGNNTLGLAEHV